MKNKSESVIVSDIYDGHKFDEITTVTTAGKSETSYAIDGMEVSKVTWTKKQKSALWSEIAKTTGHG